MRKLFLPLIAALALAAVAFPAAALASPPGNDDFANATVVSSLPFADTVSNVDAGYESGESSYCGVSNTVWYSFTPSSDETIRIDPAGSSFFGVVLNAYRQDGASIGGLSFLTCAYYSAQMNLKVQAGQTYYLQAGSAYWGSGDLHLSVDVVPPPGNDNFADAAAISSLPYSDSVEVAGATVESDEPAGCVGQPDSTAWYSFTPSESGSVSANGSYYSTVAAYTGSQLNNLSLVDCRNWGNLVTFHVEAGTTYYFQVGPLNGASSVQFQLVTTPDPTAGFYYYPGDPSMYDTVQLVNNSYDPGQVGFSSFDWDLGDGTTASGCCPTHRYSTDGDYTVELTVTTLDGRTGTISQVVHVRTHDVAITKFAVPQSASAGQTRSITVGVADHRYPETVTVQLYKSVAGGGFVPVGSSTQSVPVRGGNRTTDFTFNYTFTGDDAALGKVTFQAVASLPWPAHDALPADNTAISLPTKVNR